MKIKVLLVEDSPTQARMIKETLPFGTNWSFDVHCAEQLDKAIVLASTESFDVVLLDLTLPDSQGLETFQRFYKNYPQLPIIVLTSLSDDTTALEAMQQGAQDYLEKGDITPRTLARAIRYAIERSKVERLLLQKEKMFRDLLESAPNAMVIVSEQGKIIMVNTAADLLFGYEKKELIGQQVEILIPDRFRQTHVVHRDKFFENPQRRAMGSGLTLSAKRKDGSEFPVEISLGPLETDEGIYVTATIRDITERKKIDQMKNEFISIVSHELRTPLTSIRGSLGIIAGGMTGEVNPQTKPLLDIAVNNCERLIRLINDILDIEKIESGKMGFKIEPIELISILEQTIEENQHYATQYQVQFFLEDKLPEAKVSADNDRLVQVIANLLSNAAKFSPTNGIVKIHVSRYQSCIRVAISNNGPEIPKNFQEKIFQKFVQVDSSSARKKGGTGLGLSICKALIEKMGGKINFETSDKETTFYFDLPEYMPNSTIHQQNSSKI